MINYCKKCRQGVVGWLEDENFVCARCRGITSKVSNNTKEADGQ